MEASTTVRKMLSDGKILVPPYQRSYSWDTPIEKTDRKTQTDVFLTDLEEYNRHSANHPSPYYFGHFLFEGESGLYNVVDGQQRLTTVVIFLAVLFARLKLIRDLSEEELNCYEEMIMRRSTIRFSTVDYDGRLFKDYIIEQSKTDHVGIDTESGWRIVKAFDYFKSKLSDKPEEYLTGMLSTISNSTCSTHLVKNESEAIQMFIFQNSRGKRPSNLEIVKATFMHTVHLNGADMEEVHSLVGEIKDRFEKIYRSISSIEYRIDEDDVLLYTLRVHFNSLWESNTLERIHKVLSGEKPIEFIKAFTQSLSASFEDLAVFFGKDEKEKFAVHSLVTLGGIAVALPFIIKAYRYAMQVDIEKLCSALEKLVLRQRVIGTRADLTPRINDVFEKFTESNKDIQGIIDRIESLRKTSDWWWAYWNDNHFEESLKGGLNHDVAKYLLWKYENHLLEGRGKAGYRPMRYEQVELPELEHIAPTTEPDLRPHGYDEYDDDFIKHYLDCLGNYLLLSKSHNASIHNDPFMSKFKDYLYLEQQKEVRKLVQDAGKETWSRDLISARREKIVRFILDTF